jgi:hypothetical protein
MSGAEGLAVISIIANVIALVDFTTDTIRRFQDFKEKQDTVPQAFHDLASRLPLISTTLGKTKARAEAGEVDEQTSKALRPVVEGCEIKLKELKRIFEKILPKGEAGKLSVFWKAWRSQSYNKTIERIANAIGHDLQALTYHHAAEIGLTEVDKAQNIAATSDLVDPKMYILSLDGGGVRALSILLILEDLMAKVNQGGEVPLRPCQVFDLIAGTGTGGYV